MTWSVATPTWVAPSSSIDSTDDRTPRDGADLAARRVDVGRGAEEVAEQLVGAVHQVNSHGLIIFAERGRGWRRRGG